MIYHPCATPGHEQELAWGSPQGEWTPHCRACLRQDEAEGRKVDWDWEPPEVRESVVRS